MTLYDLVYELFPDLIDRDDGECYVNCPFCEERGETPDTRSRLGINVNKGTWNCFNCNHSGRDNPERLFQELVRLYDLDHFEYKFSWRSSGDEKDTKKRKAEFVRVSLPSEYEPLWEKATDKIHKKALNYMLSRSISIEQIESHLVGFCAVGKYAGRIIFPVYRKEKVIGFVTRAFDKDIEPRYLNSEGLKYVWNAPDEKIKEGVLLEGIFDALAAERALRGVHVVAGLGKDLTDTQLAPFKFFKEITLIPDPDKVGLNGVAKRITEIRSVNEKAKLFVVIPKYEVDWGKLGETSKGERKIRKAYRGRIPWTKNVASRLKAKAAFL